MRADIIDAEVVEDFNVDEVFKPQVVHEVEVYAGPDDSTARANLHQAGEIERGNRWSIARLIACSVEPQQGQRRDLGNFGESSPKLSMNDAESEYGKDRKTIRSYLSAWNAAARDGLCVPSDELSPEDGWTTPMPDPEDWQHYKASASSPSSKPEPTVSERDWPVVPEPTPEELFQRLEKVRAQNIADGISKPPRTREEREADGRAFVESLIGKAERQSEPATPEDKFAKALNAVGAAIRINHGVNEAALNEDGWNVLRALGLR